MTVELSMWAVTAASIVGTVANIYGKRWCFAVWMVTNSLWTVYDMYKCAYPQAALMAVYTALAVWGWCKWQRKEAP
jgi:nicotinamide riboside transporter PnuC